MHYHCEIIMPPTKDIETALWQILEDFNENTEEPSGNEFWDFYVVGGRFAGTKETCGYAEEKISAFYEQLKEKKITVSGFQSGKQSLSPPSQIPVVDKLWNDFFPTENGEIVPCPLFEHSNNQYDSNDLISYDICRFDEIPSKLSCERIIFAAPSYDGKKTEATFMLCQSQWNGVNFMPIAWDGKVASAIEKFKDVLERYGEEYQEKCTPKDNWLCITVDYHS